MANVELPQASRSASGRGPGRRLCPSPWSGITSTTLLDIAAGQDQRRFATRHQGSSSPADRQTRDRPADPTRPPPRRARPAQMSTVDERLAAESPPPRTSPVVRPSCRPARATSAAAIRPVPGVPQPAGESRRTVSSCRPGEDQRSVRSPPPVPRARTASRQADPVCSSASAFEHQVQHDARRRRPRPVTPRWRDRRPRLVAA